MIKHFNVSGDTRKKLVKLISSHLGVESRYLGAPSFAYSIGNYTVNKDGSLSWDEDDERTAGLLEAIKAEGFTTTEDEEAEANRLCISFPKSLYDGRTLENLKTLVQAKDALMKKAFRTESLEIVVDDEKVSFPWFELIDSDHFNAYTQFITAITKMAREQKRILGKERTVENEKYAFRCFLLRLGFIGDEYKLTRKILLENLEGSAAFKIKKEEA